ncbi:putative competence-damage inducible protein [Rubripirellula amarantea]|uniref:Putative competence-damage inducible protein n=1 Tax=Rubripirellula amarantea TaxID=2527999 RepID=A0A5C5WUX4_9BACT|nr:CinA family nicotinamide mononucleotide deamidase-related protein [Rubripirellula amarantea]TWT54547.1 putative competence-damage inducible protein [Rubripirellula amarantea]
MTASSDTPTLPMTGEVISIGDEMTSGARLDTNAQWLSRRMGELGIEIQYHSTVGDSLANNIDVFRVAANRADVIVCTGGLGPTRDDLTREALAALANQPLVMKPSAMAHIESMFAKRNREMPARNRNQAMFPEGSDEIFNPQGTAPGVDITVTRDDGSRSRIFALPGVPAEMKQMFDDTVAPRIMESFSGANHIRHHVMKFFGTGESDMEERLGDMIDRNRTPRVGITVSSATISLRISATGVTPEACQSQIDATREEILTRVGEFYFGDGETFEQQDAIELLLAERNQSLAIIEYGLAAPLGDWFAALGKSHSYVGGLSFANAAELARMFGCDDHEIALATIRQNTGADWTLLVDSYPLLDHTSDKPVEPEEVRFLVTGPKVTNLNANASDTPEAGGNQPEFKRLAVVQTCADQLTECTYEKCVKLGGHPSIVHARIAKAAMAFLRSLLANQETL